MESIDREHTVKRPEKFENVLENIKECLEQKKYTFSRHALDRVEERGIDTKTAKYILLNGYEEKRKTCFDKDNNTWKYAIRGMTEDELPVRIIVSFDEDGMVVITVMYVLDGR
jgi:hypothetical protein